MMKKLSKLIDIILYIIVAVSLTSAITSALWDKPMFFSSVRSNSMYPLFQRGDMILIKNLPEDSPVNIGDIVLFKSESGYLSSKGWIVHRIIDGNEEIGYITKGDANDYTDQAYGGTPPIKREWISSKVLCIGKLPLKIPLVGYLPLWLEEFQANPYIMPVIAVVLAVIVGISEFMSGNKKRKKRKPSLELQLIYFFSGLVISVIVASTMLTTSERIIIPYEISDSSHGMLTGSDIGIIKVGDKIEKPISELSNKSFFPITATITTNDEQISFSHNFITLKPGNTINATMKLDAKIPGKYQSTIYIGMFYPFLPGKLIYSLSIKSYWLALVVVSLIPGLPLMLYPLIDRKLRNKTIKEIRRLVRRIRKLIPLIN